MARNDNHEPTVVILDEEQNPPESLPEEHVEVPVEVLKYAESDPEEVEIIPEEGAPGTFIGEYPPSYEDLQSETEERTDLPEGYLPGSYIGDYSAI